MQIKLLQLNSNGLRHEKIAQELFTSGQYDFLCFQEIAGRNTIVGNLTADTDVFERIGQLLGKEYIGELAITDRITSSPDAYEGIAIFYKKSFHLLKKNIFWLNKRQDPFPSEATTFETMSRNVLYLSLQKDDKTIDVLTTHLAWAPTPEERYHQTKQNQKLFLLLKQLSNSFILGGDFNLTPNQSSVKKLREIARNLTGEYEVTNTLDPILHRSFANVKPGLAVDYILCSKDMKIKDFSVLENIHVSDHLALEAVAEI